MNSIFHLFLLCTVFLNCSLFAAEVPKRDIASPFCVTTIPKSGSHLLLKALYLISGWKGQWAEPNISFSKMRANARFPWTHFCIKQPLQKPFSKMKKIVMIRDPRDICISAVHMILTDMKTKTDDYQEWGDQFAMLSFDEQLMGIITGKYIPIASDKRLQWSIAETLPEVCQWVQNPNTLVCCFEDLVGEQGGGTRQRQEATVTRIANFLNLSIPLGEVEQISALLYGDDHKFGLKSNFREGQAGNWKWIFQPQHKQAFKEHLGSYLIQLGYETDDQW